VIQKQVVVIGGGPAGLSSAIAAAQAGARVTVIDENQRPGGQLFKQIHKFFGSREHYAGRRGIHIGTEMLKEAEALNIEVLLNSVVYGIFEDRTLGVIRDGANLSVRAERVVIATGASENPLVFPGWTLPGVMGAGAAQTMVNLHGVLPGKRCLMVGSGNVGLIVSYQLLQAGADVVAIVEADSKVGGYHVHAEKIRRHGVPILLSHTIREARGKESVEEATLVRLDKNWHPLPGTEQDLQVDFVCLAVGLTPLTELGWMANCRCQSVPGLGGFVLHHNDGMETTVPGIYAAGDCAGVEEASIAMEQGRLAGLSIAESLGLIDRTRSADQRASIQERLKELRRKPAFYDSSADLGNREASTADRASLEPLKVGPGYPTEERFQQGPTAIVECMQEIPCDPCAYVCPRGAISVGRPITKLPHLDTGKCTGCGLCIPGCPGLAIFVVDNTYSPTEALLKLPHEFLPLPKAGEIVEALDRYGRRVTEGRVIKVENPRKFDHTPVVSVVIDKRFSNEVRAVSVRRGRHGR